MATPEPPLVGKARTGALCFLDARSPVSWSIAVHIGRLCVPGDRLSLFQTLFLSQSRLLFILVNAIDAISTTSSLESLPQSERCSLCHEASFSGVCNSFLQSNALTGSVLACIQSHIPFFTNRFIAGVKIPSSRCCRNCSYRNCKFEKPLEARHLSDSLVMAFFLTQPSNAAQYWSDEP